MLYSVDFITEFVKNCTHH